MKQIFHQIKPSYLVGSGSNTFFEELIKLLDPTCENFDHQKFKVTKKKAANANSTNVSFYQLNRNNQDELRKRIYELELPGKSTQHTKEECIHFINSILPMSQELIVACLGNLLKYLSDNHLKWQHAFFAFDKNPIITNIEILSLESQVLIDENSFNSLNIFSNIYHPSSFKMQIRKDGLSLFNLLNKCSSSVAVQELKTILRQPTRNIQELNLRHSTVEWCLKQTNIIHVQRFKFLLSGLINLHAVFRRIIVNHGNNFNDWKSMKRTIFNINTICQLCSSFSAENIGSTIVQELGSYYKESTSINGILFALEKIVDIESIEEKKRFIVKKGLDQLLDKKKESVNLLLNNFNGIQLDGDLLKISSVVDAWQFIHFPEIGFVVGTALKLEQLNLQSIENDDIELILNTVEARYFFTEC